jgi:hypothetical protein
VLGLG